MIRTDRGMLGGRVLIASSEPHPECAGRDLTDIAARWGVHAGGGGAPPAARQRHLFPDGRAGRAQHPRLRRDHDRLRRHSDRDKPHPRLWGTFPRVLGHYSRDLGLFPLETAVWKMTGLTARAVRPAGRGACASATMPMSSSSTPPRCATPPTTNAPTRPAEGIDTVIVNGAITWQRRRAQRRARRAGHQARNRSRRHDHRAPSHRLSRSLLEGRQGRRLPVPLRRAADGCAGEDHRRRYRRPDARRARERRRDAE